MRRSFARSGSAAAGINRHALQRLGGLEAGERVGDDGDRLGRLLESNLAQILLRQ